MQEMGISLTLPDYRLIFDKIDYNDEGEIDYFKFCLLDYDKEQLRQKLSEGQTVSSGMFRTSSKSSGVHQRYPDGVVPKNKDPSSFVANIQEGLRTQTYLDKKREIRSINDGFVYAKDLPNDHVFGVKTVKSPEKMKSIM